jgi:tetratricopeptide (TPR) repeat protein
MLDYLTGWRRMTWLLRHRFKFIAPKFIVLISALALLSAASSFAGEKPFTEVRSPNFRVLTNGSEHDARRIALEFEQMRAVFAVGFPKMRLTTGAPLLIFAVQTENDMKSLAPAMWKNRKGPMPAGLFDHGWEKQFAIVRIDQDVPGAYNVVYHEYVHTLLHSNFRWLPTWLDEGLAEFYGNTRFEPKKSYVGAPSTRVYQLKNRTLIPLETLLVVNPWSYYHGDENQISTFYAESWALVHYLVFGPDMELGKRLSRFYAQLQAGNQQIKAFREVFGDLKNVDDGLQKYVQAFAFHAYAVENLTAIQEKDFSARKLTKAESDAEIAGYRLWERDAPEATDLVEQALQEDPALGAAHEEKAFLNFREGKDEDAVREFSRACELDKTLYLSQYFKAMMTAKRETPEQREALRAELQQITQINPQFAPAFVQLAMLDLADGQDARALASSRKAEQLEPSRAGYHLLSGEILLRMKREKEAAESARYVAERWHGPDHNEAVALWNRIPAASRPADATVVEEVAEQSQTAEGKMRSIACGEKSNNEVTLQRGDDLMVFKSKGRQMIGYSDTLWYGSDHFSLCHHVEGMHAVIRYRPAVSKEYAGDWMSIELRDELPPEPQQQAAQSPQPPQSSAPAAAPPKQD